MYRKKQSKKMIIGIIILLIVFLYILNKSKIIFVINSKIIIPIQSQINDFFYKDNNCNMQQFKNIQSQIQTEKIKLLIEENRKMKKTLNFLEDNDYLLNPEKNWEIVRLIGRDQIDQNIFIVNRGADDGIKKGMPVIKDNGILIGKIIKVMSGYSYFILITDNRSKIYASINNDDKINGIVKGVYNLSIKMDLIPINKDIKKGDIVITSGDEEFIPRGLLIGTVDNINKMDNDIFQNAELKPFSSFDELTILTIVK